MLFKESIKRFTPPNGWGWASISDVAKLSFSSVDKKSVEGEKAVRLCNYMDVFYNRRIREGMPFMASTASDSDIKKFTLNKDDVVLTKDSETPEEIAFAAVIDEQIDNLVCGYHLAVLRPDKAKVTGEYLMSAINFHPNHDQFVRLANGATRFGLGIDSLNNALIPLPPLAEQRKIAEILRTWDEAIETAEAELKAKQERKRWIMDRLFKFAPEEQLEVMKMQSAVDIVKGEQLNRHTLTEVGSYPVWNGGVTPSGYTESYNTEGPAVIMSEGGNSCGAITYVSCNFWRGGHCYHVVPNEGFTIDYIFAALKYYEPHVMRLRVGSGLPNIQKKTFLAWSAPLHKSAFRKKVASLFSQAQLEANLVSSRIDLLRYQKRGLMQKLLTGEVRVAA